MLEKLLSAWVEQKQKTPFILNDYMSIYYKSDWEYIITYFQDSEIIIHNFENDTYRIFNFILDEIGKLKFECEKSGRYSSNDIERVRKAVANGTN